MRRLAWPASRPRSSAKTSRKLLSESLASRVRTATARASFNPPPTFNVSCACSEAASSSPTAAATPPWARGLEPASNAPAVRTPTEAPCSAARNAADKPAAPEPTMSRSNDSGTGRPEANGIPAQLAGAGASDRSDEAIELARSTDFARARALTNWHQSLAREQRRKGLAEVTCVEPLEGRVEDCRIHGAQLGKREFVGQQLERDPRVAQFGLNAIDGHPQHVGVIECQRLGWQTAHRHPVDRLDAAALGQVEVFGGHQSDVGHRDDAATGVASWIAERAELLEVPITRVEASFGFDRASGGCVERLIRPNQDAWQGELVAECGFVAAHEEDLPAVLDIWGRAQGEDDDVDGDHRVRIEVRLHRILIRWSIL